MGFVKTPQEIAALETAMAQREYRQGESISIRFSSDASILAGLIPPPLQLLEPVVNVSVSRFRGGTVGPFESAAITIPVVHEGHEGGWLLTSFYSRDAPVLFGIYTEGAAKKQADVSLERSGRHVHAHVDRNGRRILVINAELTAHVEPSTTTARTYCLVAHFSPTGVGFVDDPILTATDSRRHGRNREDGHGTVVLQSGTHDPLGDIPIGVVQSVTWVEADHASRCREVTRVAAQHVAPFLYARMDDWAAYSSEMPAFARGDRGERKKNALDNA